MKAFYTALILAGLMTMVLAQNSSFTGGSKDPADIFGALVDNTAIGLQHIGGNGVAIGIVFVVAVALILLVLVAVVILFIVVTPIAKFRDIFK